MLEPSDVQVLVYYLRNGVHGTITITIITTNNDVPVSMRLGLGHQSGIVRSNLLPGYFCVSYLYP